MSMPVEEELKPRAPLFQGFSEFAAETTQFLGHRQPTAFDDDFANFGTPYRSKASSTADEVLANIQESRQVTERVPDLEPEAEVTVEAPAPKTEEPEDKERFKKKRRRGRGKDRAEEEATGQTGTETPEKPVSGDVQPISFDDVPFVAVSEEPKPVEESIPSFGEPPPPEEPKPRHKPRRAVVENPAPVAAPAPVTSEPEQRGFGFGIFDE